MERHDWEPLEAVDELLEADMKSYSGPDSRTGGLEEQLAAAAAAAVAVGSVEKSEEVGAKEVCSGLTTALVREEEAIDTCVSIKN